MSLKSFTNLIKEDIAPTPQQRFDRAIYLSNVERKRDREYKRVPKDEFEEKLRPKLDKIDTKEYDKTDIYRLADRKEIWLDRNNRTLGEVYFESDDGDVRGDCESYWVNTDIN